MNRCRCMNKRGQVGFTVRLLAGFIIILSLPFLIMYPSNVVAQIAFGFGNFLMIIGGLTTNV